MASHGRENVLSEQSDSRRLDDCESKGIALASLTRWPGCPGLGLNRRLASLRARQCESRPPGRAAEESARQKHMRLVVRIERYADDISSLCARPIVAVPGFATRSALARGRCSPMRALAMTRRLRRWRRVRSRCTSRWGAKGNRARRPPRHSRRPGAWPSSWRASAAAGATAGARRSSSPSSAGSKPSLASAGSVCAAR